MFSKLKSNLIKMFIKHNLTFNRKLNYNSFIWGNYFPLEEILCYMYNTHYIQKEYIKKVKENKNTQI